MGIGEWRVCGEGSGCWVCGWSVCGVRSGGWGVGVGCVGGGWRFNLRLLVIRYCVVRCIDFFAQK